MVGRTETLVQRQLPPEFVAIYSCLGRQVLDFLRNLDQALMGNRDFGQATGDLNRVRIRERNQEGA